MSEFTLTNPFRRQPFLCPACGNALVQEINHENPRKERMVYCCSCPGDAVGTGRTFDEAVARLEKVTRPKKSLFQIGMDAGVIVAIVVLFCFCSKVISLLMDYVIP